MKGYRMGIEAREEKRECWVRCTFSGDAEEMAAIIRRAAFTVSEHDEIMRITLRCDNGRTIEIYGLGDFIAFDIGFNFMGAYQNAERAAVMLLND